MKRRLLTATITAAIAAAVVVFALNGVTIDLSRWRGTLAQHASDSVGFPVRLDGALTLTLRRDATLRTGEVHVLNPGGFTTPDFVALNNVQVRFDLIAAVRGRLQVRAIDASAARLNLERDDNGHANWIVPTAASGEPSRVDVGAIALRDVAVEYRDARTQRQFRLVVDEFIGAAKWNEPLQLAARGRAADESRFALTLAGGALRLLQEPGEPWPFTLDIEFLDAWLKANGGIDPRQRAATFNFEMHGDDFTQLLRLTGTDVTDVGCVDLRGTATATVDAFAVTDLRGRIGTTDLTGRVAITFDAARPRVSGELAFGTLDLDPFLRDDAIPAQGGSDRRSLRDLIPVDADLNLNVQTLRAASIDLRDAAVQLQVDAHGARAPIRATFAGVPFSGRLALDTGAAIPSVVAELDAQDAAVGDIVSAVHAAARIEGTLGSFALRLAGRGETVALLARDLEMALAVKAAQLRYRSADGRSIPFALDTFDASLRPGERVQGSARGSVQGRRATLSFRGGTLSEMLGSGAMPLTAELATGGAVLRVDGTAGRESDMTFQLNARRVGELAPWLAVAPDAKLQLTARGHVGTGGDAWRLDGATVKLGRSAATIDVRSVHGASPFVNVAVRASLIDVTELATLGTRRGGAEVFPQRIALADSDIRFDADRIAFKRFELRQAQLAARVRGGRLEASPIAARFADTPVEGTVSFDPTGEVPEAALDLNARAIEIGRLLRAAGVAEDIDGRADALEVSARARGRTLDELAARSSFAARATGGSFAVHGAPSHTVARIALTSAVADLPAGGRLRVDAKGTLDETPITVEVESGSLTEFLGDANRIPFALNANGADARASLTGTVLLPLGRGGELDLEMTGTRLDALNDLARTELPPWGPWSLRGPIEMTSAGYEVPRLELRVGDNRLIGNARLDVSGPRPRLDVRLKAPSVQLDDFPLPEYLADEAPAGLTAEEVRRTARELARKTDRLLSAGFLRRLDAHIDLEVREVLSGADRLADGVLRIRIQEGRLSVGPADLNIPGGTVRIALEYDASGSDVAVRASAKIKRFNYGILARRLNRSDHASGHFSANIEIAGRAPSLYQIMRHADGSADVAIWPENLGGRIFNLWSVNLLLNLLPLIDPGGEQHINCMVGRFDMKDGVVSDDKLLIDTTRVRVRGSGFANFQTDRLDFVFRPRAKGMALFRLQTPLRVVGTLTDYSIGIDRRDLIFSTLRMIASPVLVPWERLTLGPLPVDGADVCTDPLRE